MIYSKITQSYLPVTVESKTSYVPSLGNFTQYLIKDGKIPVGKVDLVDKPYGVHVEYIKKMNPGLYSGFGKLADQLEVEHCLNRGLVDFEIRSEAGLNSHALHYLRGKRFESKEVEEKVKKIIEKTPKGWRFNTLEIGKVPMFMPKELIEKYIKIIKKHPLILK